MDAHMEAGRTTPPAHVVAPGTLACDGLDETA